MHAKANTEITLRLSEAQAIHLNDLAEARRQIVLENSEAQAIPLHADVIDTLSKINGWLSKVLP